MSGQDYHGEVVGSTTNSETPVQLTIFMQMVLQVVGITLMVTRIGGSSLGVVALELFGL